VWSKRSVALRRRGTYSRKHLPTTNTSKTTAIILIPVEAVHLYMSSNFENMMRDVEREISLRNKAA
jgi:hypothetical protein